MQRITIVVLALLLSACEKVTYIDYYIYNQSSGTVSVTGTDIIHDSSINRTINPDEKMEIAGWSKPGKATDLFEPTAMFGTDLIITNAAGDTLTKDYTSISTWMSDVEDERAVALHEYVLVVTDADF